MKAISFLGLNNIFKFAVSPSQPKALNFGKEVPSLPD